jgi:hypothetical protein
MLVISIRIKKEREVMKKSTNCMTDEMSFEMSLKTKKEEVMREKESALSNDQ